MDFDTFDALTFDCYGTLIDWERGILTALGGLLGGGAPERLSEEQLLERFGSLEAEAERGAYRSYRAVLRDVALALGRGAGRPLTELQAEAFAASVVDWPPFSDTVDSLRRLGTRYRLAIVSNVDDDLFAGSAALLGASFEHVVTAEQVGSYKPDLAHFHEALRRLELPASKVLHVAQSLFHDVGPARRLGIACVWVNRRAGRPGGGATLPANEVPDLEVPDLASLVARIGLG